MLLTRLAVSYYRPDFTEGQALILIQDMLEDLAEFKLPEIEVAIRKYRREAQNKFFPRGADLRAIIQADKLERFRPVGDAKPYRQPEFGEGRPAMWEYQPKRFWKAHWRVEDLDAACDPDRRKNYDQWLAAVKAEKVKGKDANNY